MAGVKSYFVVLKYASDGRYGVEANKDIEQLKSCCLANFKRGSTVGIVDPRHRTCHNAETIKADVSKPALLQFLKEREDYERIKALTLAIMEDPPEKLPRRVVAQKRIIESDDDEQETAENVKEQQAKKMRASEAAKKRSALKQINDAQNRETLQIIKKIQEQKASKKPIESPKVAPEIPTAQVQLEVAATLSKNDGNSTNDENKKDSNSVGSCKNPQCKQARDDLYCKTKDCRKYRDRAHAAEKKLADASAATTKVEFSLRFVTEELNKLKNERGVGEGSLAEVERLRTSLNSANSELHRLKIEKKRSEGETPPAEVGRLQASLDSVTEELNKLKNERGVGEGSLAEVERLRTSLNSANSELHRLKIEKKRSEGETPPAEVGRLQASLDSVTAELNQLKTERRSVGEAPPAEVERLRASILSLTLDRNKLKVEKERLDRKVHEMQDHVILAADIPVTLDILKTLVFDLTEFHPISEIKSRYTTQSPQEVVPTASTSRKTQVAEKTPVVHHVRPPVVVPDGMAEEGNLEVPHISERHGPSDEKESVVGDSLDDIDNPEAAVAPPVVEELVGGGTDDEHEDEESSLEGQLVYTATSGREIEQLDVKYKIFGKKRVITDSHASASYYVLFKTLLKHLVKPAAYERTVKGQRKGGSARDAEGREPLHPDLVSYLGEVAKEAKKKKHGRDIKWIDESEMNLTRELGKALRDLRPKQK